MTYQNLDFLKYVLFLRKNKKKIVTLSQSLKYFSVSYWMNIWMTVSAALSTRSLGINCS